MNQMGKESKLWEEIKEDLRRLGNVGEYGFESYISQLTLKADTGTKLVLEYPADMFIDWVETYYSNDIRNSAARVLDAARELEYVAAGTGAGTIEAEPEEEPAIVNALPLPAVARPAAKSKRRSTKKTALNSGLNTDYTFDSFVVGSNSEFAVAAAKAVVTPSRPPMTARSWLPGSAMKPPSNACAAETAKSG